MREGLQYALNDAAGAMMYDVLFYGSAFVRAVCWVDAADEIQRHIHICPSSRERHLQCPCNRRASSASPLRRTFKQMSYAKGYFSRHLGFNTLSKVIFGGK